MRSLSKREKEGKRKGAPFEVKKSGSMSKPGKKSSFRETGLSEDPVESGQLHRSRSAKANSHIQSKNYEVSKDAIRARTSKRLQETIPEFDPDAFRPVPRRPALSDFRTPAIAVSNETGIVEKVLEHQSQQGPLKPMPKLAITSSRHSNCSRSSSPARARSSTMSSDVSPLPSPTQIPDNYFKSRSNSAGSQVSTFSSWSRPSSTCSLLPSPLCFTKKSKSSAAEADPENFEETLPSLPKPSLPSRS